MDKKMKQGLLDELKSENTRRELTREGKIKVAIQYFDQTAEFGQVNVFKEIDKIVDGRDMEELDDKELDQILDIKRKSEEAQAKKNGNYVRRKINVEEEKRQEKINLTPEAQNEKEQPSDIQEEVKEEEKVEGEVKEEMEEKVKEAKEKVEETETEEKPKKKDRTTRLNPKIRISPNNPRLKKIKELYLVDNNIKAIAMDMGISVGYVRNCVNYLIDNGEL